MLRMLTPVVVAVLLFFVGIQAHAGAMLMPQQGFRHVDLIDAVVRGGGIDDSDIVLIKGKPRLKPAFQRAAKPAPKAVKPVATLRKPIGVSGATRGRPLAEHRIFQPPAKANGQLSIAPVPHTMRAPMRELTATTIKSVRASLRTSNSGVQFDKSLRRHISLGSGEKALQTVELKKRVGIKSSFSGEVRAYELTRPMIVQRTWGGEAKESGNWFSRKQYKNGENAQRFLALPADNTATKKSTFILPKGSIIIIGKAADMSRESGFRGNATGGGEQIYLTNSGKFAPKSLNFGNIIR